VSGNSRSLVFEGIDGFKGVLELACESGENLGAKIKDVYFLGTSREMREIERPRNEANAGTATPLLTSFVGEVFD